MSVPDRLTASLADRYTLEHELGQGGMATVYLARDLRHDRRVAIKVLRPELGAVIGADRFLSEIRTTADPLPNRHAARPCAVGSSRHWLRNSPSWSSTSSTMATAEAR